MKSCVFALPPFPFLQSNNEFLHDLYRWVKTYNTIFCFLAYLNHILFLHAYMIYDCKLPLTNLSTNGLQLLVKLTYRKGNYHSKTGSFMHAHTHDHVFCTFIQTKIHRTRLFVCFGKHPLLLHYALNLINNAYKNMFCCRIY